MWHAQNALDPSLFIRGFLVTEWLTTFDNLGQNDPTEMVHALLHSLWQSLFAVLWKTRNNILHKTQNFVTQRQHQHDTCDCDLKLFKMNAIDWLGPQYIFLNGYDVDTMPTWSLLTKQEMVRILITAMKIYKKEGLPQNQQ